MIDCSSYNFKEGEVLLIDKPYKWTSFDVVKKLRWAIRKLYGQKKFKVGHAGTLDPLATGLLVICTGRKTKEIDGFIQAEKEYEAEITFGATTPSFDLETEINETFSTENLTEEGLREGLNHFLGEQIQYPPIFSAKRIDGKRAYESARKGEEVKMRPNQISISELELLSFEGNVAVVRVACSKGTYIRSLANDLGKHLGCGAHLSNLKRTRSGTFSLTDALSVHELVDGIKALPRKDIETE